MARDVGKPIVPELLEHKPTIMLRRSGSPADAIERSDQYARYQALVRRATEVFGDAVAASRWLSTPSNDFGGQVPLMVAQENGYSVRSFESIFARIEHGIDF